MGKNELIYYAILIVVPALFFLGVILFAKPSAPKKGET